MQFIKKKKDKWSVVIKHISKVKTAK